VRERLRFVVLPLLLGAVGCATADYTQPIDDFAAATRDAKTALDDLDAQTTEAYRASLEKDVLAGELLARQQDTECQATSTRCRLVVIDRQGEKLGTYPPEPALQRSTVLMTQIDRYAASLKTLLEDDTADEVASHVNAALGSVQDLAGTVATLRGAGTPAPAAIAEFKTPVGAAIHWVVGQYVARVKLEGLQRATADANPVIGQAAELFATVAFFAADAAKKQFANDVGAAEDAMRAIPSADALSDYVAASARYDAFLTSAPPDLFGAMRDAHGALADSLQSDEVSFAIAYARIQAFAREAEKLAKILRDLRAIGANEEGSQ